MPDRYDGPERRREPTLQSQFEQAVEVASARAAQHIAEIERWRLVAWTFLTALLAAFLAALIMWLVWLGPNEKSFARQNAIYDCQLFKRTADTMEDFVNTDANLRENELKLSEQQEVLSGEAKVFGKTEVGKIIKAANKLDQAAYKHWEQTDIPKLRKSGSADCVKHLGG